MDNKNTFPAIRMHDARVLPEQIDWMDAFRDPSKVTIRLWPDDDADFDNCFQIDDKSPITRTAVDSQKKLVKGVAANNELAKRREVLAANCSAVVFGSPFRLTAIGDRHFVKEAVDEKTVVTHHATLIAVSVPTGTLNQYVMMQGGKSFSIKHAEPGMEHYWLLLIGSKDDPLTFMYHNGNAEVLTKILIMDQLVKKTYDLKDMTSEEVAAKIERMAQKANVPPAANSAPLTPPVQNGGPIPVAAAK